jgi:hypothetical protein
VQEAAMTKESGTTKTIFGRVLEAVYVSRMNKALEAKREHLRAISGQRH